MILIVHLVERMYVQYNMSITNTSKPTTSLVNSTRVVSYETWDSNPYTWDNEVRSWDQCASTMTNSTRPSSSMVNTSKP